MTQPEALPFLHSFTKVAFRWMEMRTQTNFNKWPDRKRSSSAQQKDEQAFLGFHFSAKTSRFHFGTFHLLLPALSATKMQWRKKNKNWLAAFWPVQMQVVCRGGRAIYHRVISWAIWNSTSSGRASSILRKSKYSSFITYSILSSVNSKQIPRKRNE